MKKFNIGSAILALSVLSGCYGNVFKSEPVRGEAVLNPTAGNAVRGKVLLSEAGPGKVRVVAEVTGLSPGAHGFHIHEKGDCSAPDGSSAGGHYNPARAHHGHPDSDTHHAGDLPQLIADSTGLARLTAYLEGQELASLKGLGFIVHAAPDDFKTQPTGNSGARQACGVIVLR